ncbi:endoglucanase isoform X3 [Leptinotarsa decemlineata]|uniref:endoglucanase isoform X3 n=1 Tax=Leptinotarsa decemlineata TaxID=7539 RepID=UPI003D30C4D6
MFQINVFVRFDMGHVIALASIIFGYVASSTGEYSPNIIPVPGGLRGTGFTTGYWDCCKPSCSWRSNLRKTSSNPVSSCAKDGVTVIDPEAMSNCGGGPSYMCSNQQPFVVNSTLAYGFTGASFTGKVDYQLCCGCVLLSFIGALSHKKMIVQITNTGADAAVNQFDLALPGTGVGINNGCISQWNAPPDGWGKRYGGIGTKAECAQLPRQLQDGCRFRFEFMESVPVPKVNFVQVECPKEIVDRSHCNLK